jgi:hypothetical protein
MRTLPFQALSPVDFSFRPNEARSGDHSQTGKVEQRNHNPLLMSNYIPHYTKKRQILHKKEEKLRRLISHGADKERLLKAAEEVRLARIRAR